MSHPQSIIIDRNVVVPESGSIALGVIFSCRLIKVGVCPHGKNFLLALVCYKITRGWVVPHNIQPSFI